MLDGMSCRSFEATEFTVEIEVIGSFDSSSYFCEVLGVTSRNIGSLLFVLRNDNRVVNLKR